MTNEVMKKATTVVDLDGFNDFTSEVEGEEDINVSSRVIQGGKLKYLDPRWLLDDCEVTGMRLTAMGVLNIVNRWNNDNKPLETCILAPGERFPNFDQLNDKCDRSEWRERFGNLTGPYSGQHALYFIDEQYNRFTWPSQCRPPNVWKKLMPSPSRLWLMRAATSTA